MASYIDAAAIVSSGTALVLYQQSIGVTGAQIGVLSGALTFCIAIGALTGGRLGDLFGRRAVFIVTMAMTVIGASVLVASPGFTGLLIGTILVGLGTGADLPVSLATIAEAATDENRGKLVGFSQVLWFAGILATYAISTAVGDLGRVGGQIMFAHVGVVALVVLVLRFTIPESAAWSDARDEKAAGVTTVRASRHGLRDVLTQRIFLVPFLALLVFYTFTNLGANTGGQFGAYVAVNVVGLSVPFFSTMNLVSVPVGMLLAFWFMRVVDSRLRMPFYVVGAVCLVVSYGLPLVFGFSLPTLVAMLAFGAVGNAFAFEAIMKIWSQESFPTLLRGSVQGTVIAVARVAAALLALVTPLLLDHPEVMYGILTALVAVGVVVGWLAFHRAVFNAFTIEGKDLADAQEALFAAGLRDDAPAAAARRDRR
ncbi:MFS transporter [Curtobacterium sp. MCPF17_002]|uniref:MFS transporter n=1 Tax=Curtobacterium sp. MCPF17_002 TaxID=2175645 RepID=UPI000DA70B03|nr:MFS transporter [Curtobacterium sp. MCPF17_002]WIB77700.1 MFS transporter [Curtobacterium sp. MCPF17_002]